MSNSLSEQLWDMIGVIDRDSVQFLCIGSMLLMGDAVAPIVGTLLADKGYDVFGTEDYTLNAENILSRCEDFDPSKTHIAIDCSILSLNSKRELYESVLIPGAIYPGAGVGKSLGCYGEYGIHIPMAFNRFSNTLTVRDLADHSENFVRQLAREVFEEIELYFWWCDVAMADTDDTLEV